MENMLSKQDLIRKIQELSFAAVDLNLFLDTHPNNLQAIQDFNYISTNLKQMMDMYNQKYGPFANFGHSFATGNYWSWVADDEKWPWEGMGV